MVRRKAGGALPDGLATPGPRRLAGIPGIVAGVPAAFAGLPHPIALPITAPPISQPACPLSSAFVHNTSPAAAQPAAAAALDGNFNLPPLTKSGIRESRGPQIPRPPLAAAEWLQNAATFATVSGTVPPTPPLAPTPSPTYLLRQKSLLIER